MGEFEEAFREQNEIMKLDAVRPVNDRNYGLICAYARQYARSNAYLEKSLEFYDIPNIRMWMASNYALDGKFGEARKELKRALELQPLFEESSFDMHVAYIYAFVGEREEALEVLAYWEERQGLDRLSQTSLAAIYALLGERELALDRLDEAFEQRCPGLIYLRVDPVYDPLRSESRFQELVARMSFPNDR
jgi:tetratricopeptide (TPR) repeat protein